MTIHIAVYGTDYLGATHATGLAELGHDVLGVDVDVAKLAKLNAGEAPFFEPELEEALQRNIAAGRLRFTSSFEQAATFGDAHFIAVGTPQKRGEFAADMRYIDAVIETLAPLLTKPTVIFGKSTVPVGTARRLKARVRELAPAGDDVEVAWNPDFLREGYAVHDTLHPDRLVLGVDSESPGRAEEMARKIYAQLIAEGIPFLVTDLPTAETCQSVGERVPRHQDLVHQRHGRSVRGLRCRRDSPGRCPWPRQAHRAPIPQCGSRFWRRLPAQGHQGVHGPRR
jgi:UDPglucose 6-dehydrogenase